MRQWILLLTAIIIGGLFAITGCASVNGTRNERVRLKEPRISPLPESQWTDEQKQILEPLRVNGRMLNLFPTLVRNPEMAKRWLTFASYILRNSTLPARDREILILRIGWLCGSEYEFGQHTVIGKRVGLTDEDISRITKGPDAKGWSPFDATLIKAVDELHADAFITDNTWNALTQNYDEKQMLDLIMTVGQYNLVSMFLNSTGVQLDKGIPGFPKEK